MSDEEIQNSVITEERELLQQAQNNHLNSRIVQLGVELKKVKQENEELKSQLGDKEDGKEAV